MIRNILELKELGDRPQIATLPTTIWHKREEMPTLRQLYEPAFEVDCAEDADLYLAMLVIWRAHQEYQLGQSRKWDEITDTERECMAWYALAFDASALNCVRRGIPTTLEKIGRLYGAYLPEKCRIGQDWLPPKIQAIKDRAERDGKPITDFEARIRFRKTQERKRDDKKRDRPELFE